MKKLIIDVGCNVGNWISANYSKDSYFIGIEANRNLAENTKKRFKNFSNIQILNYLVSNNSKTKKFYISDSHEISTASEKWLRNSRYAKKFNVKWNQPVNVNSTTLDDIINKNNIFPNHIKIDVEGYEYQVLKGLTHKVGMISFEYCDELKNEALKSINYLNKLGYKNYYISFGDKYDFIPNSNQWKSYNIIRNKLLSMNSEMKNWGMIYVK